MNTKNVSATNVRVNLTEVISRLDADNRVAITKHGKVIAYLVAHVEEEVALDSDPAEDVEHELHVVAGKTSDGKSQFHEILDDEEEVELDAGELACETTPSPNYEPDPDLDETLEFIVEGDDEDFDSFLTRLKKETLGNLEVAG